MNLLLVDSTVPSIEKFLEGINENTQTIIYSNRDSFEGLQEKIANLNIKNFDNIGIVFVGEQSPIKMFVSYNSFISFNNNEILSNNTTKFINELVTQYSVKKLDFLACNLLNSSIWKNYFNYLMKENEGLIVRASNDRLGNLSSGGNWILESTYEDISQLYFNENINNWNELLDSGSHSLIISSDGSLFACGINNFGQHGDDNMTCLKSFEKLDNFPTNSTILQIACGRNHTVILVDDGSGVTGSVMACGGGSLLGNGESSPSNSFVPSKKSNGDIIQNVTQIACGVYHTAVIIKNVSSTTTYELWSTGQNTYGQLGDGTTNSYNSYVQSQFESNNDVTSYGTISKAFQVSCGNYHTAYVTNDSTGPRIWSCGRNNEGQLGINKENSVVNYTTKFRRSILQSGVNFNNALKVVCGGYHTIYISTESTNNIYGCGHNEYGQLGLNHNTSKIGFNNITFGMQIGVQVTDVACGEFHTMVLTSSGELYGTGFNNNGQLGIEYHVNKNILTRCKLHDNITENSVDAINIKKVACSLYTTSLINNNDMVFSCGYNSQGTLGIGNFSNVNVFYPTNLSNASNIVCGGDTCIVVKLNEEIFGCGNNVDDQLAIQYNYNNFQLINGVNKVLKFSTNEYHSAILKKDGTVWVTGKNNYGQLGLGQDNFEYKKTYTQISADDPEITEFLAVSCGKNHTALLTRDGRVFSSGRNNNGQLGIGSLIDSSAFSQCIDNSSVNNGYIQDAIDIACGENHTIIVRQNGIEKKLWACGDNSYGQLGTTDGTDYSYFKLCDENINDVEEIACGRNHTAIIRNNNGTKTLWCCGLNNLGQFGNNTTTSNNSFTLSTTIINPVKVQCGGNFTAVIDSNKYVWTTGDNGSGQLGTGSSSSYSTSFSRCVKEEDNSYLSNIIGLYCGDTNIYVINESESSQTFLCGSNLFGQLGISIRDGLTTHNKFFVSSSFTENSYFSFGAKSVTLATNTLSDVNFGITSTTKAYYANSSDSVISARDVSNDISNTKNALDSYKNKIVIELNPPAIFTEYVEVYYNLEPNIIDLVVYMESLSDSSIGPVLLEENADNKNYGAFYTYDSTTGLLTVFTNHFTDLGFGYGLPNLECLNNDTKVLTPKGYINITELNKGDKVITSNNKIIKIKNIKKYIYSNNKNTNPFKIPKNYFGENCPSYDTRLSKGHNILVNGNWITPIKNKHVLEQDNSLEEIIYYHIELENYKTDHLVVNGGLIVESYAKPIKTNAIEWKNRVNNSIIINKIIDKNNK